MSSGKTIRSLRKRLGLTQVEFGEKLKIMQCNVSAYEIGNAKPSIKNAIKIVKFAKSHGIEIALEDLLT
jgi:transcriptional regulator with XRE-family HTH domain